MLLVLLIGAALLLVLGYLVIAKPAVVAQARPPAPPVPDPGGPYRTLYQEHGTRERVDPRLLRAVAIRESSERPNASRYEAMVTDRTVGGRPAPGPDTSRGLMQVLEFRARELGYTGPAEGLFDPSTNIRFGAKLLRREYERAGAWPVALSVYNAGWSTLRPNDAKRTGGAGSPYLNQRYVDDVLAEYARLGGGLADLTS